MSRSRRRDRNLNAITPKAFANFSPGFELARTLGLSQKSVLTLKGFLNWRTLSGLILDVGSKPRVRACENPGTITKKRSNPERVPQLANPFRVDLGCWFQTQGSRSSNPGLKLANAFGVISQRLRR